MFMTNPENLKIVRILQTAIAETSLNGSTVPYSYLDNLIGFNIRKQHRHLLYAAWEAAEKQCQCMFESIRDVGLKRTAPNEIPHSARPTFSHIRHAARKKAKRMHRVSRNEMSADARQNTVLKEVHLELVANTSYDRKTAQLVTPAAANPAMAQAALANLKKG